MIYTHAQPPKNMFKSTIVQDMQVPFCFCNLVVKEEILLEKSGTANMNTICCANVTVIGEGKRKQLYAGGANLDAPVTTGGTSRSHNSCVIGISGGMALALGAHVDSAALGCVAAAS
jgi:acid phosphatase family membrane protein YuiD